MKNIIDDEEEAGPSSKPPKPLLRIHGAQANKLQCSICQETCDKKHPKRKKIEIKSQHAFKSNANVFSSIDWNSEETLYGFKSCKAMFSNENLRKS